MIPGFLLSENRGMIVRIVGIVKIVRIVRIVRIVKIMWIVKIPGCMNMFHLKCLVHQTKRSTIKLTFLFGV